MNRNSWTAEDRAEYDRICEESWAAGTSSAERIDAYLARMQDAVQAQRYFARDCEQSAMRAGAAKQLKRWREAQRPFVVDFEGVPMTQSRVVGTRITAPTGDRVHTQALFEYMTREQLEAKVRECATNVRAFRRTMHVALRLIDLLDERPEAATPAEAARLLGTSVHEYLEAA